MFSSFAAPAEGPPATDPRAPSGLIEIRAELIQRLAQTHRDPKVSEIAVELSYENKLRTTFYNLRELLSECEGHLEKTQAVARDVEVDNEG